MRSIRKLPLHKAIMDFEGFQRLHVQGFAGSLYSQSFRPQRLLRSLQWLKISKFLRFHTPIDNLVTMRIDHGQMRTIVVGHQDFTLISRQIVKVDWGWTPWGLLIAPQNSQLLADDRIYIYFRNDTIGLNTKQCIGHQQVKKLISQPGLEEWHHSPTQCRQHPHRASKLDIRRGYINGTRILGPGTSAKLVADRRSTWNPTPAPHVQPIRTR